MARASGEGSYFEVDIVLPKHTFDFHRSNRLLPYEGGGMAAGPASRLGSTEPREKTGLRLSP